MSNEDSGNTPESSAMDIVSMAFSDVSGNGDLMEVVTTVSDPVADGQVTATEDGEHAVHCVEGQVEEVPNQSGPDQPNQIEIPLPHNAIITVNEQGEQVIEFPQVVTEEPGDNCVIIDQQDQPCHVQQPGPGGDVGLAEIAEGGNGLETITFHEQDVEDEHCVGPVAISVTDVQNIQEVVSSAVSLPDNIISCERTEQVSDGHVVTTGMSGLSANSILGSFANIIHTSTVLTNSSNVSLMSSSAFASAANVSTTGVDLQQAHMDVVSKTPILGSTISTSPSTAPQFIHNGTNLQQVTFNNAVLPQTSLNQSENNTQPASGGVSVINSNSVINLPLSVQQKSESLPAIGNRSVFSPMTLTIRTPPGSPAVNQTLINSIVNNTEVQALLKRNPGQPITIVRVPEDPYEKRNRLGLTAKIITTNSSGTFNTPSRPGRLRKDVSTIGNNSAPKTVPVKRRGRQPGSKYPKKEEHYVPPPAWKPVKSRTRSGRISRPPMYRTEHFRTLPLVERSDSRVSDDEEMSDQEQADNSQISTTQSGRLKTFKCHNCSKAYIGRAGLSRHFLAEPSHGNIEEYEKSESASSQADMSTLDDTSNKSDGLTNSETIDDRLLEESASKSPLTVPLSPVTQPEAELDNSEPAKDTTFKSQAKRRRGRPPCTSKDPSFRPGMSENVLNARKKDKQKDGLKNTLRLLSNEDFMDVCLPRLASSLSPWEFLLSKAEITKDDSSEVLRVLQLFEELVSEVREMALNCLEKADDNEQESEGIFLDEDDDLARVLDFEKGWYKVSEPPPGVTDLPFRYKLLEAEGIASTLKRTVEIISKDDIEDEQEHLGIKKMKLEKNEKAPQNPVASPKKIIPSQISDSKSVIPAQTDDEVQKDLSVTSDIGRPVTENNSPAKTDTVLANTPSLKSIEGSHIAQVTTTAPAAQTSNFISDAVTPLDQEQPTNTESPAVPDHEPDNVETPVQEPSSNVVAPMDSEQHATTGDIPESSNQVDKEQVWTEEGVAGPSEIGAAFVQAAEELSSLSAAADAEQGDMKGEQQPDQTHQEETSVVVPEGSTIMQMQDGTFLVQRPDGTAMQIHTPEGMTIETVQELLSMEIGQG